MGFPTERKKSVKRWLALTIRHTSTIYGKIEIEINPVISNYQSFSEQKNF